jgi:dihydropteroate synthase
MAATPSSDRKRVLREAGTVKDVAERVLANGAEPAYATEKLLRTHAASVRALIHGLHADPQELIDAIEKESEQ